MRTAMVAIPPVDWEHGRLRLAYLDRYRNQAHLGPYLLGGLLQHSGYDVQMVDLVCQDVLDRQVIEGLAAYDVILLSANSCNWPTCALLITWLKQRHPHTILVLGGIHATLFGEDVLSRFPVDYVIRGEGETALPVLLRAIRTGEGWEAVPGLLAVKENGTVLQTPLAPLLQPHELDVLPLPLYEQMPADRYQTLAIESSRGCKGNCSFCATPHKRSWRPMSAEAFVDRVEALSPYLAKVRLKRFSVVDDCFTISKTRTLSIIDGLEHRGIDTQFGYATRVVDFLDEELVERIAPYSRDVVVGAESFLPETLRRIRKPLTPEQIVACARLAARCGMAERMAFSFIIGFPWESKKQVQENISHICNLALDYGIRVFLQWHALTPGSDIWTALVDQGRVSPSDMDDVGYLFGEKWFGISSGLSVEERLDISNMVTCVQKVLMFTKPLGSYRGEIVFAIPPYLTSNPSVTKAWREAYAQKMARWPT